MENQGFKPARWELLWGQEAAIEKSRNLIASRTLPQSITFEEVTHETSTARLKETSTLMANVGLMPIPGALMRGLIKPGVMLLACDRMGAVIATATARMIFHDKSHHGKDAFWGFLATREDHRGKGIALHLGARAIVMAAERFGATGFFTGVAADNKASISLITNAKTNKSIFDQIMSEQRKSPRS